MQAVYCLFNIEEAAGLNPFTLLKMIYLAMIKSLDPHKAHGCDNITIKIIKIHTHSLILFLKIIFEQSV